MEARRQPFAILAMGSWSADAKTRSIRIQNLKGCFKIDYYFGMPEKAARTLHLSKVS